MHRKLALTIATYIAAITAANLLVAHYGPAVTVINAFALIGVDLALRDVIDDELGARRWPMLGMIAAAGAISYVLNPASARIAAASCAAFTISALADWGVYRKLRGKAPWSDRANASNTVGAAIDSVAFPLLAFGYPPLYLVMLGQFAAKVGGGALLVSAIDYARNRRSDPWQESVQSLAEAYATMGGRDKPSQADRLAAIEAVSATRLARRTVAEK